jgi:hypothetical protein
LNNIKHEKQHLDALERRHSETAKEIESCTDESKAVFLRRSNQEHQDAVDNQRFLVENLEFQQLEVRVTCLVFHRVDRVMLKQNNI